VTSNSHLKVTLLVDVKSKTIHDRAIVTVAAGKSYNGVSNGALYPRIQGHVIIAESVSQKRFEIQ